MKQILAILLFIFSFTLLSAQDVLVLKSGKEIKGDAKFSNTQVVKMKFKNGEQAKTYNARNIRYIETENGKKYPLFYTTKTGKRKFNFFTLFENGKVQMYVATDLAPTKAPLAGGGNMYSSENRFTVVLVKEGLRPMHLRNLGMLGPNKKRQIEVLTQFLGDNEEAMNIIQTNNKLYKNPTSHKKPLEAIGNLIGLYNESNEE